MFACSSSLVKSKLIRIAAVASDRLKFSSSIWWEGRHDVDWNFLPLCEVQRALQNKHTLSFLLTVNHERRSLPLTLPYVVREILTCARVCFKSHGMSVQSCFLCTSYFSLYVKPQLLFLYAAAGLGLSSTEMFCV